MVMGAGAMTASAAPPMVTAKLDSATMLMGTRNTLRLEVVQDKGVKGKFPLFEQFGPEGIVTLLNDTIELSRDMKIDTVEVGSGRIQINCNVPIQVFDSGMYRLPAIDFVAGKDTARTEELLLTVTPVAGMTADTPIAPFTDVAEPENPSIFDALPDWLYYYWWAILLGLALFAGGIFLWRRLRSGTPLLPKKPRKTPYEIAISALNTLKSRKLWETGHEKEYYTDLTDILRRYLDGRFGIKAMEMTSNEIMSRLADLSRQDVPRDKMRDILDMADFVKFAMVRPLPDDNVALYRNAVDFVESTKPRPVEESDGDESPKTAYSENPSATGRRGRSARHSNPSKMKSESRMKVGRGDRKGAKDALLSKGMRDGKEVRK